MEEWDRHFRDLVGEVKYRMVRETGRGRVDDKEPELRREEINRAIERVKEEKAVVTDGISGEVWKFRREKLKKWVWKFCNRVWRGKEWVDEWNEEIIVKMKGEESNERLQRCNAFTNTVQSLCNGAEKEVGGRDRRKEDVVLQNQAGFRKGMGILDNI